MSFVDSLKGMIAGNVLAEEELRRTSSDIEAAVSLLRLWQQYGITSGGQSIFETATINNLTRPSFTGIYLGESVPTAVQTTLTFTEYYTKYPISYNTTLKRIVCASPAGTLVSGGGSIEFAANATGRRQVYLSSTGSLAPSICASIPNNGANNTVVPFSFGFFTTVDNEQFYVSAYQDSGSSIDVSIRNMYLVMG